jgi:hypothetical protein
MSASDWFWSSSTSYAAEGAGSNAVATSPTQTSSQQTYSPGATGSSAIATASPEGSTVHVSVTPAAENPSPISFPEPSPIAFPKPSPDLSPRPNPLITPAIFAVQFRCDGKIIKGRKFSEALKGSGRCDRIHGDRGNDHLSGKNGNDWIVGGQGDDRLSGGQGDDWLEGGDGRDVLGGDLGQDMLTGGKKGDRFVCRYGVSDPRLADVITDFNSAEGDVIQIAGSGNFTFEVFDSDSDGMADATLVRAADQSVYAIVLSSVRSGLSTISQSHIIS